MLRLQNGFIRPIYTLSKGTVISVKNRYLEVLSSQHIQRGEGQGTHIEYIDLQSFKRGKLHARRGEEFPTVELRHLEVEMEAVSDTAVTVVDQRYRQIEVPLSVAPWAKSVAKGSRMQLVMAEEKFVRLSPPGDLKFVKSRLNFPSVSVTAAPKGTVLLHEGRYIEVQSNESKHVARQAGFVKLETTEVLTGKKEFMQFSANGKVHKVEIAKEPTQVQYVDKQAGAVIVADADYNTMDIPVHFFKEVLPFLEAGTSVTINRDTETGAIVRCQFATALLQKARAAKK